MPDLYLSDTRRIRHTDGLVVLEYLAIDGVTWVPMEKHLIYFEFFDDFFYLSSDRWQIHQAGGVGAAATLVNAEDDILGGVMQLAVTGADNHRVNLKLVNGDAGASWKITKDSGKQLWFATKVKVPQVEDLAIYVGLFNPAECAFGHTLSLIHSGLPNLTAGGFQDGIYFRILTATPTEIDFAVAKDMNETEVEANIKTNDAAWHELGFHFDGVNTVTPVIDRVAQSAHEVAADAENFPDDVGLLPIFSIQTGENVIKSLRADWIRVRQER